MSNVMHSTTTGRGGAMTAIRTVALGLVVVILVSACGFVGTSPASRFDPPGFFDGVWHGLVAPYTLVLRLFFDLRMYAVPNTGWTYDAGFLIGVAGSIPFGWVAAIIAVLVHIAR